MDEQEKRSPFSSFWFLASAIFVAVLIVGGILIVGIGRVTAPSREPQAPKNVAISQSGEAKSVDDEGGECPNLPADDAPVGVVPWNPIVVGEALVVPHDPQVGPAITEGISRCFAHSPTGALYAAANWLAWFSSQNDIVTVVDTLMVPSEATDRLRVSIQTACGRDGNACGGPQLRLRGFRTEWRSHNEVLVSLAATPVGADDATAFDVAMIWDGNDWKVRVPDNNTFGSRLVTSLNAEHYTLWGEW